MDFILLFITTTVLLFSLRKVSKIRYSSKESILKDVKNNVISLMWGVLIILAMILIPYQVWVMTGASHYWDGVYIVFGTAILTIIVSFTFYYFNVKKFNLRVE